MKKLLAVLLALLLAACLPVIAEEETDAALFTISGTVIEINDEYFVLNTFDLGEIQVNYDETTVFESLLPLSENQYAFVTYAGQMTRSLPPQVFAMKVAVYTIKGEVIAADLENGTITVATEDIGEVVVHVAEPFSAEAYAEGDTVIVYHNGMMTMSLPPQITGSFIVKVETVSGAVTEIDEEYIVIANGEETYQVNLAKDTVVVGAYEIGTEVTVAFNGISTRSLPAQITAIEIVAAAAEAE